MKIWSKRIAAFFIQICIIVLNVAVALTPVPTQGATEFSWDYTSGDIREVQIIGIGMGDKEAHDNNPATLLITDASAVLGQVVTKLAVPEESVDFTPSPGTPVSLADPTNVDQRYGSYYESEFGAIDQLTAEVQNGENDGFMTPRAFSAYITKNTYSGKGSVGRTLHHGIYWNWVEKTTQTETITIPTSPVVRDVEVTFVIADIYNGTVQAVLQAQSGGVAQEVVITFQNQGDELLIYTITLPDVPGTTTEVAATVTSPAEIGQSILWAGINVTLPDTNIAPDLTVSKSGPESTLAGATVSYLLNYQNLGDGPASNAVITETVPNYTTFSAADSTSGWSCADLAPAGTSCEFSLGDLTPGESGILTFAVIVDSNIPAEVEIIKNTTSITDDGAYGDDSNTDNNTHTIETHVTPPAPTEADLELEKTVSTPSVEIHTTFEFYITVTNQGPADATGIQVRDELPSTLVLGNQPANYDPQTGIWEIGNLAAGASATLTLEASSSSELSTTNTAEIIAADQNDPDSIPDNNLNTEDDYDQATINISGGGGGCVTNCGGGITIIDQHPPIITIIAPTKKSYNPITDTTIIVTDDISLSANFVEATGGVISCKQITVKRVECTSIITESGDLRVKAKDHAGHRAEKTEPDYEILAVGGSCTLNCADFEYDVYLINPDGVERHMYTKFTIIDGNDGVLIVHFEDQDESQNSDFDYNDVVVKIDTRDCENVILTVIDGDASWHHQIRARVFYQGILSKDILLFADSHTARKQRKTIEVDLMDEVCSVMFNQRALTPFTDNVAAIIDDKLYAILRGKVILKVEGRGEAYWVHPGSQLLYDLDTPSDTLALMQEHAVGISDADLNQIPVGLATLTGIDSDQDGLPDIFEDAIGTNKLNADTDGDGFNDRVELEAGYSPILDNGAVSTHNTDFANQQAGHIFLQVEGKGQVWYVNPGDGMRYLVGNQADAFQIRAQLGVGISNANFDTLVR